MEAAVTLVELCLGYMTHEQHFIVWTVFEMTFSLSLPI